MMRNIAVIGAGRIGIAIAKLLDHCGDYQLLVVDNLTTTLEAIPDSSRVSTLHLDIGNRAAFRKAMEGVDAIISCCPYVENVAIAKAAQAVGASYFDLTEDNETTVAIREISRSAKPGQVFIPQCGLAPGFIVILGHHICQQFDKVETLKLRVGALPEFPSNLMMYNLTWNTQGLINEYCSPCHALKNGEKVDLVPLEGLENFSLDGMEYEAFNTSGGLGTLCDTMQGKIQDLSYKTIRYRGHQYLMDFLINGLKLGERRQLLKKIFENAVAVTRQDVVVIMVSATGRINGQLFQVTDSRKIYHGHVHGEHWGAIQITTAASVCAVVDLFFERQIPQQGFVSQEQIDLERFIDNRFGSYYLPQDRHSTSSSFVLGGSA